MNIPLAANTQQYEDEIDLREMLLVLWRQRLLIAFVTLAAVLAAVVASLALPKIYRVEALVEMERLDQKSPQQNEGKEILESRALLAKALQQLAIPADPLTFKATGEVVKDTDYLKFSLEGRDPGQVAALAGKMLTLFVDQRNQLYKERRAPLEEKLHKITQDLEQSEAETGKINQLVSNLEKAPLGDLEKRLYELQLSQLRGLQAQEKVGLMEQYLSLQDKLAAIQPARVVDGVSEPVKVRPRLLLNVAVAFILGLMVGIFLAFGRNMMAGASPGAGDK
ncbi:Wzz/FepE/Etk N-terminal domain-containing protein [Neomoorella thermoacetica]|uniref:Wzz/FepE/Etk N-terminal domain-containing protein n=1 Tax=Neomoorella thermoacetica TaxID=1525 RepID=UPI0008FB94F9|nr:Wzz/FepE/Etk N-terminal domain-containing protein [Moorella thermoacetica]OIQ60468.1 cryptic autophosphorylating protein tyrosine kinase Etk [Moorella thermoacetica]